MNRSALVIKMLNYLYANGRRTPVSRDVLAQELETNVRNIVEFKKELETAGYLIESVRGKDGGYLLCEDGIFPSLALNEKEKQSIHKAVEYLQHQSNFDSIREFENAMNKLKARITGTTSQRNTIYLDGSKTKLNDHEKKMLDTLQEAKNTSNEVEIEYRKGMQDLYEKRRIRPYEIIVNSDGYYVLAEDVTPKKTHSMKVFKIIEERMQRAAIHSHRFVRDESFKLSQYIGEYSLLKDEYEVTLKINGFAARLVNEQDIENTVEKYWEKDNLYITFIMEGKYRVKNFILSLGSQCEVLSPIEMKEEIKEELINTLKYYQE